MSKVPFPASVDEEIVEWIKQEVEKGQFRNRSHLVEQAIVEFRKRHEHDAEQIEEKQ